MRHQFLWCKTFQTELALSVNRTHYALYFLYTVFTITYGIYPLTIPYPSVTLVDNQKMILIISFLDGWFQLFPVLDH